MKHIKRIIICILCTLLFIGELYAASSSFIKKDSNGNIVNSAVFELKTIDGTTLETIRIQEDIPVVNANENEEPNTLYNINYIFDTYEKIERLFNEDQKSMLNHMDTYDNYLRVKDTITLPQEKRYCFSKEEYIDWLKDSKGIDLISDDDNIVMIGVQSVAFLEEVRTPLGLEKTVVVIGYDIILSYRIEADESLTLYDNDAYISGYYKYDPSINYNDLSDLFSKMDDNLAYTDTCGNLISSFKCDAIDDNVNLSSDDVVPGKQVCLPVFIDNISTEDVGNLIEIKTYINGKTSTTLEKNSENIITVFLNNKAKTPLYGNIVTSFVPDGLNLISASIDNEGIYDEENRLIKWDFNYLDAQSVMKFTYKVSVPPNAPDDAVYRVNAKIQSNSLDIPTISSDATADLNGAIENPDTGDARLVIAIVLFIISIASAIFVMKKNKINEI